MAEKNETKDPLYGIKLAEWRYGLIAPVILGTRNEPSDAAYYRKLTEKPIKYYDGSDIQLKLPSLARWVYDYRVGGFENLKPKVRSDKGDARVLTDEAINRLKEIMTQHPKLKGKQIYDQLVEEGYISYHTSVRSVQRYIKNHNLRNPVYQEKKERKAFEAEFFGDIWQADTCYFPHIREDGKIKRTYCMGIIDDHSRMIVASEIFTEDSAINFQSLLKKAISTYGIPKKLFLDNGAPYANGQLSLICGNLGVVLIHAAVRDGAAKGKIEKFWRRSKEQFLYKQDMENIKDLDNFNDLYLEFIHNYNHTGHQGINNEIPYSRYFDSPKLRSPESEDWLTEAFMNRIVRKVRNDSTISIDSVWYDVPQQFIGSKIEVRYIPNNIDNTIHVFENNASYPVRRTNKVENSKVKRKSNLKIDYSQK